MGINLTEISQKVLDTVSNASNVFRKMYDLHYNPNPIDVPMEYIDENGQKRTTQVPNVAKFRKSVWDDVGGALGQFNRTFYVDQQNGDDNNEGSTNSSLKSIQRAIDLTPAGGVCHIYLLNDYLLSPTEHIRVFAGKIVYIHLMGKTISTSYTISPSNQSFSHRGNFVLYESSSLYIDVGSGKIILPENSTDKPLDPYTYPFFSVSSGEEGFIHFKIASDAGENWCEIHDGALVGCKNWNSSRSIIKVTMYPHYNRSLALFGNETYFVNGVNSLLLLNVSIGNDDYTGYIKRDGTEIAIADAIGGVVRDANNLPRNVVSNIVL